MTRLAVGINPKTVDIAVNELIMTEENKGGFKRGELKPFLEELEKKYDIPFNTLKNRYYRDVKANVKPNATKKGNVVLLKKDLDTKEEKKTKKTKKEIVVEEAVAVAIAPAVEEETKEVETPKQEVEKPIVQTSRPMSIDESIMHHANKQAEKIFTFPRDYYKMGQLVDVKVSNVQTYGVFCEILDGKGFQALCHISEMVDGYIKKVTDYLDVGDVVSKARICLIENKRLNITMKHLHLQKKEEVISMDSVSLPENPPINNLGEQFGNLKDKLLLRATEQTNDANEVEELFAQEGLSDGQKEIVQKYERDIEEMTSYLQEQLGALTPQAKLELASIIEEQGVFKTTRGILKTQENFRADIGLLFMRQMREKLGEYL